MITDVAAEVDLTEETTLEEMRVASDVANQVTLKEIALKEAEEAMAVEDLLLVIEEGTETEDTEEETNVAIPLLEVEKGTTEEGKEDLTAEKTEVALLFLKDEKK